MWLTLYLLGQVFFVFLHGFPLSLLLGKLFIGPLSFRFHHIVFRLFLTQIISIMMWLIVTSLVLMFISIKIANASMVVLWLEIRLIRVVIVVLVIVLMVSLNSVVRVMCVKIPTHVIVFRLVVSGRYLYFMTIALVFGINGLVMLILVLTCLNMVSVVTCVSIVMRFATIRSIGNACCHEHGNR